MRVISIVLIESVLLHDSEITAVFLKQTSQKFDFRWNITAKTRDIFTLSQCYRLEA